MLATEEKKRASALIWWKALQQSEKERLAKKHFPHWTFEMVNASSSKIQQIWELEF